VGASSVPFDSLRDFIVHLERYVDSIAELNARDSIIDNINENGVF